MTKHVVTLSEAKEYVEFWFTEEPECDYCSCVDDADMREGVPVYLESELEAHGWTFNPMERTWLLRCKACSGKSAHPWLAGVDVERVQRWMQRIVDRMSPLQWIAPFDIEDLRKELEL